MTWVIIFSVLMSLASFIDAAERKIYLVSAEIEEGIEDLDLKGSISCLKRVIRSPRLHRRAEKINKLARVIKEYIDMSLHVENITSLKAYKKAHDFFIASLSKPRMSRLEGASLGTLLLSRDKLVGGLYWWGADKKTRRELGSLALCEDTSSLSTIRGFDF